MNGGSLSIFNIEIKLSLVVYIMCQCQHGSWQVYIIHTSAVFSRFALTSCLVSTTRMPSFSEATRIGEIWPPTSVKTKRTPCALKYIKKAYTLQCTWNWVQLLEFGNIQHSSAVSFVVWVNLDDVHTYLHTSQFWWISKFSEIISKWFCAYFAAIFILHFVRMCFFFFQNKFGPVHILWGICSCELHNTRYCITRTRVVLCKLMKLNLKHIYMHMCYILHGNSCNIIHATK